MTRYIFSPKGLGQQAVISSSQLDSLEHEMISSVVNWNHPDDWASRIFGVAGRSIIFHSPTRKSTLEDAILGEFGGLQLIGAGGNTFFVQTGIVKIPNYMEVFPVDPSNHADLLKHNSQLWHVNGNGKFVPTYRQYVPLHGMDDAEAENRARYSNILERTVSSLHEKGKRTSFVVPILVAEGYFPHMLDDNRTELQFQVYRVPTVNRLPSQLINKFAYSNHDNFVRYLREISYFVGGTLRNLHGKQLAYMDPHIGNMSLIKDNHRTTLFITDLGSIVDISQREYASNYRGFDMFMYLTSMQIYLEKLIGHFGVKLSNDGSQTNLLSYYLDNITRFTLKGYFRPEIVEGYPKVQIAHSSFEKFSTDLVLAKDIQSFVELFNQLHINSSRSRQPISL